MLRAATYQKRNATRIGISKNSFERDHQSSRNQGPGAHCRSQHEYAHGSQDGKERNKRNDTDNSLFLAFKQYVAECRRCLAHLLNRMDHRDKYKTARPIFGEKKRTALPKGQSVVRVLVWLCYPRHPRWRGTVLD